MASQVIDYVAASGSVAPEVEGRISRSNSSGRGYSAASRDIGGSGQERRAAAPPPSARATAMDSALTWPKPRIFCRPLGERHRLRHTAPA